MNSTLRFDGPRLEEVLERVQAELGPDVNIVDATRTRRGGFLGFFAREWFEVVVDAPASVEDSTSNDDEDLVDRSEEDPLLALAAAIDDHCEPSSSQAPSGSQARSGSQPRSPEGEAPASQGSFALALAIAERESALGTAPDPGASGSPQSRGAQMVPAPRTKRLRDLDLAELLGHLESMVPAAPLPTKAGSVVAIVGDHGSSQRVATGLAVRLGLDPTDVVALRPERDPATPAWLEVRTPDQVRGRAARWRESGHAKVVTVELAPGRDGHAWAKSMLDALGADQVRLVAKAWQLADQLGAKSVALGGVDGLDLVEIDAAAEPELFLELELPVLGIDGRSATSDLWAALLYERRLDEHHDV